MASTQRMTVLGSTGSVGRNTLAVLADNSGFEVFALSANRNVELLHRQCLQHEPEYAVTGDAKAASRLQGLLEDSRCRTRVRCGARALEKIASDARVDVVMAAIVGAAGLDATLAAVAGGKRVLLANKEALVMSGELFMETAATAGATIIPIDSEHNAVFQCLPAATGVTGGDRLRHVEKIVLTASGGPFLHTPPEQFDAITPEQALAHPRWKMGRKISVDSATMMNKGLEVIEASYLFGLEPSRIEVLVHPESIVHSMVCYRDGSVLAQMANPDMRVPIAHGLAWPERVRSGAAVLDLAGLGQLTFQAPDRERFPCLELGIEAVTRGGTAPAILNAANEEAVGAFLRGETRFSEIPRLVGAVLAKMPCEPARSLAIIRGADRNARNLCKKLIFKGFNREVTQRNETSGPCDRG